MKLFRFIIATGLALMSAFGAAEAAQAHSEVIATVPTDGSTTAPLDYLITVEANEDLLDLGDGTGFAIVITDQDGLFYGDGCVSVDGRIASVDVPLNQTGDYTVAYRIVSADGHPVEGSFGFHVDGDKTATPTPAYAERPECGVEQTPVNQEAPQDGYSGDEPLVISTQSPADTGSGQADITPWIGLATIPLIVGGMIVLIRALGKRESVDHID